MNKNKTRWQICLALAILLTLLTLSPVVLTLGTYQPTIGGIPYTLWSSILTTAGLVGLTFFGSKYLLGAENHEDL
ncbi:MAG: hypothetical protein AAGA85_13765 [Bacteroidota bacterium]